MMSAIGRKIYNLRNSMYRREADHPEIAGCSCRREPGQIAGPGGKCSSANERMQGERMMLDKFVTFDPSTTLPSSINC